MKLSKPLVPRWEYTEQAIELSLKEHLKYLQWLADNVFGVLGIHVCKGHPKIAAGISKGKPYRFARLTTLRSILLERLYDEWYTGGELAVSGYTRYIREATKVLPERIMKAHTLPLLALSHFFIGDGGSSRTYQKYHDKCILVSLSVCNFSKEEVLHITEMLTNMGINTIRPNRHARVARGSGLMIRLAQDSADRFINLVESHILEIFSDSIGPSYRDMIKHKSDTLSSRPDPMFDALRVKLHNARRYYAQV